MAFITKITILDNNGCLFIEVPMYDGQSNAGHHEYTINGAGSSVNITEMTQSATLNAANVFLYSNHGPKYEVTYTAPDGSTAKRTFGNDWSSYASGNQKYREKLLYAHSDTFITVPAASKWE